MMQPDQSDQSDHPTPRPDRPKGPVRTGPAWLTPLCEYGPLAIFFLAYWLGDLMLATKAVIVATAAACLLSYIALRRIPWLPLTTAVIVAVFGGLTLWLQDETFIKMKPTIVQLLFAAILFGAAALGKLPLKRLMGAGLALPDAAWRALGLRFAVFFLILAGLNELVWRTQSTDFWVNFKLFGLIGLNILFMATQIPFIMRHATDANRSAPPRD